MDSTSKLTIRSDRDIFYYRQRFKNRLHEAITAFFAEEVERRGINKQDIAESIGRDPAQITRWLSAPNNMTTETISDLLLSLDAEMDPYIARFDERVPVNEMHPLMARIVSRPSAARVRVTHGISAPSESELFEKITGSDSLSSTARLEAPAG